MLNLKALNEKRNTLITEMEGIVGKADTETRAFTDEETKRFDEIKTEIDGIDKTIKAFEESRSYTHTDTGKIGEPAKTKEESEYRAFENYIRNAVESRSDTNMTYTDNGAVIPSSIANKIISKVVEISPVYSLATKYNVGGSLSIPYYDESTQAITMAYADEFTAGESNVGKFTSITLTGYLARALSLVSLRLVNNSNFDIVSYVINKMAECIAKWIEKELLCGTSSKIEGLSGVKLSVTASADAAVTPDELIDLQESVIDTYQANSIWIMSRKTRAAIRKLKDKDGQYLLNRDATAKWGYTLFGKDVYVSDNMPDMEAGKTAIYYGDFSGLAVKLSEQPSIQIQREKYADQHCIGVISWIEMDSKVEDAQKIARLVMKSGT